jgi:hypothetical protein
MCRQNRFSVAPLYCAALVPLFSPSSLDWTGTNREHKLHLHAKIDGNGPIFIELCPGEVQCCDGEFWSQNSPGHNSVNISSLPSIFTPAIIDIISCIYVQKSTATDQYWLRYGPTKFDVAMASFEVKTRRAITLSILVLSCHIIH